MSRGGSLRIRVVGDASNFTKTLDDVGGGLGKFAVGAAAMLAGLAAAGGAAAFKVGKEFHEATSNIRVGTGQTGKALEDLQGSFRNVVRNVPADFGDASTAVADLSTRLGLTGQPLEDLSGQFLNLARITGGDVAQQIKLGTRVFGDWDVATEQQSETLDKLFRASQASGAGIEDLMGQVVQFGAPLRGMGFGLEESVAMFAKFEQEGVNAELVIGSLRQGLGRMARAGEDAPETFRRVVDEIAGMEDRTKATALAMELFGARAGPDMAAAIQEGRFELGDMLAAIEGGSDTINAAAADTEGFSEKWRLLVNRTMMALEPVAVRVFDAVGDAVESLTPTIERLVADASRWIEGTLVPAFESISAWWQRHGPRIVGFAKQVAGVIGGNLGPVLAAVAVVIAAALIPAVWGLVAGIAALFAPVTLVIGGLALLAAGLTAAYQRSETFRKIVDAAFQATLRAVRTAMDAIRDVVRVVTAAVQAFWQRWGDNILRFAARTWQNIQNLIDAAMRVIRGVIDVVMGVIRGDWSRAWQGVQSIASGVWQAIRALIDQALNWIRNLFPIFRSAVTAVWADLWGRVQDRLRDAMVRIREGVRDGIDRVRTFFRELPGQIMDHLRALPGQLFRFGADMLRQFRDGVRSIDLWAGIKGIFDRLPGFVKRILGITSPSRVFFDIGRNITRGLVEGIKRDASDVRRAASDLVGNAAQASHGVRGGGLQSTRGLNPQFLQRFQAYAAEVRRVMGVSLRIVSGWRSTEQQARLYARYLAGTGNLAAPPGRSMHERGLAIDHAPHSNAQMRAIARNFRLHYPVMPKEPWHVEPFARGATFRKPTVLTHAMVGERGTEHLLREDQIVDIVRRAVGGDGDSTEEAVARGVRRALAGARFRVDIDPQGAAELVEVGFDQRERRGATPPWGRR